MTAGDRPGAVVRTDVLCVTPSSSGGWGPVSSLAQLAARMWSTTPTFIHPRRDYGALRKAASMVPRRRGRARSLLIIAAHPGHLLSLAQPAVLAGSYDKVGAWIIDSFWDEWIPMFAKRRRFLDFLWITDGELLDTYSQATGLPVGWLPWGTDVLEALSSRPQPRTIDVLRLGRQPSGWDSDRENENLFAEAGLSYQGRFPHVPDGTADHRAVREHLQRAKLVLASSSLVSPTDYRHPERDYISARFTDAAAYGTLIAGQRPRCMAAQELADEIWVDIDPGSRSQSLRAIESAIVPYDAQRSSRVRRHAAANLDWRHRLARISEALDAPTEVIDDELRQLSLHARET